jgi:hypothetical protein
MKKRLISIIAVMALCAILIGSVAMAGIALIVSHLNAGDAPMTNMSIAGTQITTDNLATADYDTTFPSAIFCKENLLAAYSPATSGIASTMIVEDHVVITVTDNDPYMYLTMAEFTAGKFLAVSYSTSNATDCQFQFYLNFGTGATEECMRTAPLTVDGEWHLMIIDISDLVNEDSKASFFRIDPLMCDNGIPSDASIAIEYVAFFDTEEDAKSFHYAEYLRYVEENTEVDENAHVYWPATPYRPKKDLVEEDTAAGSLTYTPSEDGSTVTISYQAGGETYTYTVPNDNNYLFGGFAGTDDLGRPLNSSEDVGVIGENGEKHVGLFYFLWHGLHGSNALYDLQKIIDENGLETAGKVSSGLYGNVSDFHWFAEPLYGYYHSDPWVMRKHAELLTNAGVDFLYFDATNGYAYTSQALQMMKILHELNEQGYDAPQIVFYTNSASNSTVSQIYNAIYASNLYPDTWFCLNGKPVIVATERSNSIRTSGEFSPEIKEFFTFKESQWPQEAMQKNGWPWIDWSWPQRVYTNAEGGETAMSISIAQHNNAAVFSASSLYGNFKNRGRSYGSTAKQVASWNPRIALEYADLYQADNKMTDYGYNFQAQWDHAVESDVQFALVTGWNEWIAQRQDGLTTLGDDDKVAFIDCASMEFSRDAEMMRGGYFDNYYMQLIANIERFKGDAPVIVQDSRKPINVTGDFDQWDDVPVTYTDPKGDTANRNGKGYGDVTYTDTSGRNDIVSSKITHDTKNIYFYAKTVSTITMYDNNSSWMQLYLDVDRDTSTGWYGYDYLVNSSTTGYFVTNVAKYTGTNGEYGFTNVGKASYRASGNQMMIEVPLELLGISDYSKINMEFKWADSDTTYTTMEQFYTEGDVAPLGRLNYVYQNHLPGVSEPVEEDTSTTEPTTEPATSTEPPSIETTESEPAATTAAPETTPSGGGCGSAVASAALITLVAAASVATVCIRKKKE